MRIRFLLVATTTLLGYVASANAGSYPVDGLPNYNATYFGTPGTGTRYSANNFMFMTLYRDNYCRGTGSGTNCSAAKVPGSVNAAGEGTGKHPGVDISVPSGTPVKAALSGTVIRSECHPTFGGIIVTESINPYKTGEKVYVSYMHLKQILFPAATAKKPSAVTEGVTIGYSGGASSDPCHGAATGAHLHFQIDKPWGGPYPWFPTGRVEVADTDFEVMGKTYNPLVFAKGLQNWTFSENNFKEWWVPASVTASGVVNGALWLDGSSANVAIERGPTVSPCSVPAPAAPCSTGLSVDTLVTPTLLMAMNFKCNNNPGTVSLRRSNGSWSTYSFSYSGVQPYAVPLKNLALSDGIITNIRINPSRGCTAKPGPEEYYFSQIDLTR
jgi:murein DD-endopeptidase MepM/ murein hydrolase activator NlpD